MNTDRRTIFALIASGRITAAEAERLLAASSQVHEMLWIAALCAVACLAPLHWNGAVLAHTAQSTIAAAAHTLQNLISFALQAIGGKP
jgi:sorbitol-specific phosphotransferase system component IIBC